MMIKKVSLIFFFPLIFLFGCDDIFLRFKYDNYECKENKFGIKKISIYKKKGSNPVQVVTDDELLYNFDIKRSSDDEIVFDHSNPDIKIAINRKNGKISASYNKNIFSLDCSKDSFRM